MILVDTSIWIDFFDHPESVYAQELARLINKDEEMCLSEINVTEILQGIKEEKVFEEIKGYLMQFPIDAMIAAVAIENNFWVFHKDKDFDLIADCTKLKVYQLL